MTGSTPSTDRSAAARDENQPRGILRVPEVLAACAALRDGGSLAQLSHALDMPKTSLHRLLRTLEHGGFLRRTDAVYRLGPESFKLANLIRQSQPADQYPACARETLEWLAGQTSESVVLGVLADDGRAITYVDSIDSTEPLRYTLPIGVRRELHLVASGRALLAFLPEPVRRAYLENTRVTKDSERAEGWEQLPDVLRQARAEGVVFDIDGNVSGASGLAAPVFGPDGVAFSAVSIAGPTDRMVASQESFKALVRTAGERISRVLGYQGAYPPP